ncbi:unnamed protein product [Acanthosepion pharaonis]|uniref:Uncharacterized protein n=1 Tax=Acanthosepion pharaonis TaxID=158019 RepID=A0A812D1K1_ACAPH|nr:unnamed protein product [Sepia pharaonis]
MYQTSKYEIKWGQRIHIPIFHPSPLSFSLPLSTLPLAPVFPSQQSLFIYIFEYLNFFLIPLTFLLSLSHARSNKNIHYYISCLSTFFFLSSVLIFLLPSPSPFTHYLLFLISHFPFCFLFQPLPLPNTYSPSLSNDYVSKNTIPLASSPMD